MGRLIKKMANHRIMYVTLMYHEKCSTAVLNLPVPRIKHFDFVQILADIVLLDLILLVKIKTSSKLTSSIAQCMMVKYGRLFTLVLVYLSIMLFS